MISATSYRPEWLERKRNEHSGNRPNPAIVEKVVYALSLVEQLSESDLSFVFKGGTSLLLMLPEPKRFSIDVDIVTAESRGKIESALSVICSGGIFLSYELDAHRSYKPGIPKAHYKLTFFSEWDHAKRTILLDILFEEHAYPMLVQAPIFNEWIQTDGRDSTVQVPSIGSILGDKLTAFAPNTVGIRFKTEHADGRIVEKQMEVIKQLFDISTLFDCPIDVEHLKESFAMTATKEIAYKAGEKIQPEQILDDIITTSLMIASRGRFFDPKSDYRHVTYGLTQIKPYIYSGSFRIDDAIVASSKAAYLAAIILTGYSGVIQRWRQDEETEAQGISSTEYRFLNKLRNIPEGPLFYWRQALSLLGKA
ncbi:nucleotidyl transferase AbiEii/AbiGii toxin family protein [Chlorobium sp. N1]|uniref:nucleotidyl transferase AbiEii/AbiGii toxin family protein n=1 Tax=Chlorobium sp. N1 TaxID=2491138 RepID=UPI0010408AB9|nr:nucleotidyl transferase AbiEii/AbiGii toxin family protein [Chlorobium sp. N1]TCD48862.1 hypothetical protein E0L29_02975 [Chlorobium sp. N1]